jgi:hypothetical protein
MKQAGMSHRKIADVTALRQHVSPKSFQTRRTKQLRPARVRSSLFPHVHTARSRRAVPRWSHDELGAGSGATGRLWRGRINPFTFMALARHRLTAMASQIASKC